MADSNIPADLNAEKPAIILDISEDQDSLLEADKRHDVIELDHALAKSSNVASPKDEMDDVDESFTTAMSKSEHDLINTHEDEKVTDPEVTNAALDKQGISGNQYTLESALKLTADDEFTKVSHPASSPASVRRNGVAMNETIILNQESPSELEVKKEILQEEVPNNVTNSNIRAEEQKVEESLPASALEEEPSRLDTPPKEDEKEKKPSNNERGRSESIADDFFSMSYGPIIPEIKKKKKKKKLKRKKSEEPSEPAIEVKKDDDGLSEEVIVVSEPGSATASEVEAKKELPKKKPKLGDIPPPPIDEEEFKRNYAKTHGKSQEDHILEDIDPYDGGILDETNEFKNRLDFLNKMTQSFQEEKEASKSGSGSSSRDASAEPPRDYILHITSFLPASDNHAIDISVKGSKRFQTVISRTLKYFLSLNLVPEPFESIYRSDKVVLYWDKVKVLEFMKPESLNIPAPPGGGPTTIELGLYTLHQASEIERLKKIDREAKLRDMILEERQAAAEAEQQRLEQMHEEQEDIDPFKDDELFKTIEEDATTTQAAAGFEDGAPLDNIEKEEGYFKIGLKGEDNKKIVVKVHAETPLTSLVRHYLKKKGLPDTTKVKLVFDDEDLDIDGTVGDTELEEDFTIDVIINS